jgi:hypothetical protein
MVFHKSRGGNTQRASLSLFTIAQPRWQIMRINGKFSGKVDDLQAKAHLPLHGNAINVLQKHVQLLPL